MANRCDFFVECGWMKGEAETLLQTSRGSITRQMQRIAGFRCLPLPVLHPLNQLQHVKAATAKTPSMMSQRLMGSISQVLSSGTTMSAMAKSTNAIPDPINAVHPTILLSGRIAPTPIRQFLTSHFELTNGLAAVARARGNLVNAFFQLNAARVNLARSTGSLNTLN
jgi:hypothetical protein